MERRGDLSIHAAFRKGPFQTIHFLVEEDPATLHIQDSKGALPIHSACQAACSAQVIKLLCTRDRNGVLPIHTLLRSSRPLLDAIKYLVDAYPASLTAKTHSGELLVMVACEESASLNVINYLLRRAPQLVRP